jgi:hypothetical protein
MRVTNNGFCSFLLPENMEDGFQKLNGFLESNGVGSQVFKLDRRGQ